MVECFITLEGSTRPKRRRFQKLCEKLECFNGWCRDGITARVLCESEEVKNILEKKLRELPDFQGESQIKLND